MPICGMGIAMAKVEINWNNEDRIVLDLEENAILLKMIYSLLQFLITSYALTRYSILALYLRIFSGKRLRIAVWCVVAFVTLQWIGFAITAIFQCRPVDYFWDRSIPGGTCLDVDAFYRSVTPFNLLVDVVLIIMPLPTVWQLKASTTRKWALTFLFGIGIAALHIVAAAVPQRMSSWMSERIGRLSRLHTTLGRSKTGAASPTSDSRGLTDENEIGFELGSSATAQYESKASQSSVRPIVDPWMQKDAILVTTEVTLTVTQEERIEQVLGF
ncbi:hypothetical protein VMCG_00348 [Cytospora schulzeri]|uniref:Rhodopsin domain-containing protein n=1 Tax=Cytospora schulzeri TaxID=448051 RepID=A0A423X842_9PEZI|nr:hypothetical protein VMCG_00348 [Valsa malicola]